MFEAISAKCLFHEVLSLQESDGNLESGDRDELTYFCSCQLKLFFFYFGKDIFFFLSLRFFLPWWVSSLKRELSFNEWSDMASVHH